MMSLNLSMVCLDVLCVYTLISFAIPVLFHASGSLGCAFGVYPLYAYGFLKLDFGLVCLYHILLLPVVMPVQGCIRW